jgi:RimJ/RimL family protein N-acetyltransferase
MMGEVTIEPIQDKHIEGFHAALDAVCRERKYLLFLQAPPLEGLAEFIRQSAAAGNPHLVAVDDGRIVGWCDIRRKTLDVQAHCGVLGIGLLAEHQGKGLGWRLLAAALDAARSAGMRRVELGAHADNRRAIALYERLGFEHEGLARDAVKVDGRFIDSVNMAKILV